MTIKKQIEAELKSMGLTIGCYDKAINKLNQEQQVKLIKWFNHTTTVMLDNKTFVEIQRVGKEVDVKVLSDNEFISLYGENEYDDKISWGR